jgi:hypothetical protein
MLRRAQAAVGGDVVAERVRKRVARGQHTARMNQLLQRLAAHLVRVVVLVPLPEVLHVRVEASRADLVEVLDIRDAIAPVLFALVAHRPLLHHVPGIVMEVRVRHPERPEHALVGELTE